MSFLWPYMLLTLILLPLMVWLYLRQLQRRAQAAVELGTLGVVLHRSGRHVGRQRHIPPLFLLLGLAVLMLSLARPQMVVSLPRVEGTVILAFDVSNSMMAADMEPTRMEAAKAAARAFVENQPSTILIGVVAFSTGGLVVQQPTNDQTAVLDAIERLSTQGGTSLGQGIFTSLNAIAGESIIVEEEAFEEGVPPLQIGSYPSAVIVLLSDGENTGPPEPLDVAQAAAEASVRIFPVGIGSPEGIVLEVEGFSIVTRLDEAALQEIASVTNGTYYYAADAEALQEVYENIDLQLTVKGEETEVTALFAGVSLLFMLVGGALSMLWFGRIP